MPPIKITKDTELELEGSVYRFHDWDPGWIKLVEIKPNPMPELKVGMLCEVISDGQKISGVITGTDGEIVGYGFVAIAKYDPYLKTWVISRDNIIKIWDYNDNVLWEKKIK